MISSSKVRNRKVNKMAVTIKSQREIELMRESCKILADVFSEMEKAVHLSLIHI